MTDFNALISANSSLYLVLAESINAHGEAVGISLQTSTGQLHAFLATPCENDSLANECANTTEARTSPVQRVELPEYARKLLRGHGLN